MDPSNPGPDDSAAHRTFTYSSEAANQPTVAIVEAVAWINGVDVRELDPLHRSIDTTELDRLFGGDTDRWNGFRPSGRSAPDGHRVTFRYEGCVVTVTPDELRIEPE